MVAPEANMGLKLTRHRVAVIAAITGRGNYADVDMELKLTMNRIVVTDAIIANGGKGYEYGISEETGLARKSVSAVLKWYRHTRYRGKKIIWKIEVVPQPNARERKMYYLCEDFIQLYLHGRERKPGLKEKWMLDQEFKKWDEENPERSDKSDSNEQGQDKSGSNNLKSNEQNKDTSEDSEDE